MIETHRSIVTPAECDANGHLNVAEYVRRFSEAGQNLFAMNAQGATPYRPSTRHFRFHRELECDARTAILSIRIGAGEWKRHLVHVLQDLGRSGIAATCIDGGFAMPVKFVPKTGGGAPASAKPRSLPSGPFEPADAAAMLQERVAITAHRNRVHSSECSDDGIMTDAAMVARFFTAAQHLWAHSGFDHAWFSENGFGAAALEMKLTRHAPVRSGQDYAIVSWIPEIAEKTMPLSNQMVSVPEGKPLASISAVSLVMDRKTRLPVEIPDTVRRRHRARFDPSPGTIPF